ncbi:MAG: hypothetical protein OQK32_01480 [Gammaproteobacteria bacterium]|nr:hypothetical protein [Gammaproteobacteria bacterium]
MASGRNNNFRITKLFLNHKILKKLWYIDVKKLVPSEDRRKFKFFNLFSEIIYTLELWDNLGSKRISVFSKKEDIFDYIDSLPLEERARFLIGERRDICLHMSK